jgi:hypothetical protein
MSIFIPRRKIFFASSALALFMYSTQQVCHELSTIKTAESAKNADRPSKQALGEVLKNIESQMYSSTRARL